MTDHRSRSNPQVMSEQQCTESERRLVAVMQSVMAIPWLMFGHTVHGVATVILSIALCVCWIRPAPVIPRAIAWRKPRLLGCGGAGGCT